MRAGGGALVFGSGGSTAERADWLVECGGELCLLLTGILDSRGWLQLPLVDRKVDEEEEVGDVGEVGLSLYSEDRDGELRF